MKYIYTSAHPSTEVLWRQNTHHGLKKLLQIMKMTTFLLLLTFLQVSAEGLSQTVTLSKQNASLKTVLKTIQKQTGYDFIMTKEQLAESKRVNVDLKEMDLKEALSLVFRDQPLDFRLLNKTVVVKGKLGAGETKTEDHFEEILLPPIKVLGTVVDSTTGEPLAGVTVRVMDSQKGAVTDQDGVFTLDLSDDEVTLVISFVGYESKEIPLNGQNNIKIELSSGATGLDQLVVVGYGTQRKGDISGSVSTIGSKDLTQVPVGNTTNTLAGKLPGLIVVQNSGEPGNDAASLNLRGFGAPTVVVDGIVGRSFDELDPNEIESITVLKDAAAAAVYGVSAGNGVILVTTKRGKLGDPQMIYSANVGVQRVTNYPEFVNSEQYATLKNEASVNSGGNIIYSPEDIAKYREGTDPNFPNFDYYHYFVKDYTPQFNQNLSVNGGSDKIKYYFLLGNTFQDGMWKADKKYNRYNFRMNVDAQITKDIDVSVNFGARYELRNDLIQDSYLMASWMQYSWPIFSPKTPDGMIASTNYGLTAYLDKDLTGYIKDQRRRFDGTLTVTYKAPFLEGLSAKITASRDFDAGDIKDWEKMYLTYTWDESEQESKSDGSRGDNFLNLSTAKVVRSHIIPSLEYQNVFGTNHHVTGMILFEESLIKSDGFNAQRTGYKVPIDQIFAGPTVNQTTGGTASDDGRESLVGRFNYNFSDKYLFEYSFRYDASSRFPKNTRWGYFQGVSGGWRISEEPFLSNSNFFDDLKIRVSWGVLGDDATGQFQFLSGYTYPSGSYIYGGNEVSLGLFSTGTPNPNITWETSRTLNLGVDYSIFKNKLSGSLDIFNRNRRGLLAKRDLQLPLIYGSSLPDENINSDNSKGFEFTVNHQNQVGDFSYSLSLNFSFAKWKWLTFTESDFISQYDKWVGGNSGRYQNRNFGLKAIGQFNSYEEIKNSPIQDNQSNTTLRPGDIKYDDFNGDGVIDDLDHQPLGLGGTPEITYGLNMTGNWKNWSLNLNWSGATNYSIETLSFLNVPFFNGMNSYAYLMDRWHLSDLNDPNSEWIPGKYPSTINSGAPNNNLTSSFWIHNVAYMRLKSMNLSYKFDLSNVGLQKVLGIESLNLILSAYNLWTITGLKYMDPETPTGGRLSLYPQQKSYNFGIKVNF